MASCKCRHAVVASDNTFCNNVPVATEYTQKVMYLFPQPDIFETVDNSDDV